MNASARVCVVGSLHYDIMVQAPYLPQTGETLIGEAWWWKPGGKGGNQAMAAARHGARVEMIGCLGDDGFGLRLRERLLEAGVGAQSVTTVTQGSGMSVAIQQAGGDYAAIVVSGANRDLDQGQVEASRAVIARSQVLLLQNEIAERANVAACAGAREAGVTVVLNAAPARSTEALQGLVDVLVVNAVEAEQLGATRIEDLADATAAALALRHRAPAVVVTAGAHGVAAVAGAEVWTVQAHPVEHAETHGAGDVFAGALAARLADREPLSEALRYANAAAALHVGSVSSARALLGTADVRRLLEVTDPKPA